MSDIWYPKGGEGTEYFILIDAKKWHTLFESCDRSSLVSRLCSRESESGGWDHFIHCEYCENRNYDRKYCNVNNVTLRM